MILNCPLIKIIKPALAKVKFYTTMLFYCVSVPLFIC